MFGDAWRGNVMVLRDGAWQYEADGEVVANDPDRSCGRCERPNTPEGHDACLGTLPGVRNACCGHGVTTKAYAQLDDGRRLSGGAALEFFESLQRRRVPG